MNVLKSEPAMKGQISRNKTCCLVRMKAIHSSELNTWSLNITIKQVSAISQKITADHNTQERFTVQR